MAVSIGPTLPPEEGAFEGASFARILQLKRSGPEPLYYQLAQSLEEAVASGILPHGSRLPPETEMAHELRLAVATVRQAGPTSSAKGS